MRPERRVRLRPVTARDYEYIAQLEMAGDRLVRYRHRGATPAPEAFAQRLWQGVLCQFMVESTVDGEALGIAAAFAADYRGASAQLAVVGSESRTGHLRSALIIEGLSMFVDYLFDSFPFRKLYAYALEQNFARLQGLIPTFAQVEGVLREHEWLEGRWCDTYILACHRSDWVLNEQAAQGRGGRRSLSGVPHGSPARDASVERGGLDEPDWSTFLELVSSATGREIGPTTSLHTTLVNDLGMDSLALMQLLDLIDERGANSGRGQRVPDEALDQMSTLGDAFGLFAVYGE